MSQTSSQYIHEQVSQAIQSGAPVDIFTLSRRMQPVCEGMSLHEIATQVAATVALLGGAAYWERRTDEQNSGDQT
jgi:hypothetical protein